MRLVQLKQATQGRVALVEEPHLRLLSGADSYAVASTAICDNCRFSGLVDRSLATETLSHDDVYGGVSPWHLLQPIDHPVEPACCHISGTGLTHRGSARDRDAMHDLSENKVTHSTRIFQWGIASGKPARDTIGVAPEWFYKGYGSILCAHGEAPWFPLVSEGLTLRRGRRLLTLPPDLPSSYPNGSNCVTLSSISSQAIELFSPKRVSNPKTAPGYPCMPTISDKTSMRTCCRSGCLEGNSYQA